MEAIHYDVSGGVATLTLNRPAQRNAIDMRMRDEIAQCIEQLKRDREVRALVLTGAGGAFCAGGDLRSIQSAQLDGAGWRQRMKDAHAWLGTLIALDRPVIAAVDGPAFGAGFSLALAADFVVASPRARFCMSFMKLGLVPDFGAFYTLPRIVGVQRAKELMLSAREVAADEAQRLGIVGEIVAAEQVLPRAQVIATSFTGASPLAVSLVKRALSAAPAASLDTMLDFEADAQSLCFGSADHREAVARFLDKQPGGFRWPTGEDR
ncbi:enoyl-CoA hydratase/isomerase family protein [Piscinibacter sp.]|uniref:enoyl-CoA hydratase/isomerase family protein n=1 Tax=Piscinibacter sp. TaxID=1903157 RepID=UPI002C4AE6B4|nr:enoyl-CoA hydratase/isomerase family protein [Albitalea sp.]HUG21012.1 enoyl-CoA hydratase/isomerase family protein [Albitalea sp.]